MLLETSEFLNSEREKIVSSDEMDFPALPGSGMYVNPASIACEPDQKINIGQAIRALRKERGMSQEDLARKARVDRTTIVRLECGVFKSISMERLERIAAAIGIDSEALFRKAGPPVEPMGFRGGLNQAVFSLDYPEDGFKIISLMPKRREFFFGRIEIGPQITIASPKLPHPEQIYLHCFERKLLLIHQAKEFLLKPGDCFVFPGFSEYEFYNPDPLKHTSSLFVTYPSFLLA